jgi:predicted nuclease of predicted toxin-antitoxin system
MSILIDMNLSPVWVSYLNNYGITAIHWSEIGDQDAPDEIIFEFAKAHNHIIFTNDLDFGAILAAANANAPSVFQVRTQDLTPESIGEKVLKCLSQFNEQLDAGCMLTLDSAKSKVRLLPFR